MNIELHGEDRKSAKALLKDVDGLLESAREQNQLAAKTHIELGEKLLAVEEKKAWILVEYKDEEGVERPCKTFDQYLNFHCQAIYGKGRSTLYGYKITAKQLAGKVDPEALRGMGIGKARVLAGYVKKKGSAPPELITQAVNPEVDVDEFKAAVANELHEKTETGSWLDLAGFYVSKEERAEFDRVWEIARQVLNLSANISEWAERKAIWQAMAAEFLSQHEPRMQKVI